MGAPGDWPDTQPLWRSSGIELGADLQPCIENLLEGLPSPCVLSIITITKCYASSVL